MRVTTVLLTILETFVFVNFDSAIFSSKDIVGYIATSLHLYTWTSVIVALWMSMLDLVLGIRMTILVIESVRKDKISTSLKPRLWSTLALIIFVDLLIILLVTIGGFDQGFIAILFSLLHSLFSLQLLAVLQHGVKAKKKDVQIPPVTVLSEVPSLSAIPSNELPNDETSNHNVKRGKQ